MRALKPAGEFEFSEPPSPVRSVMYAMVIGEAEARTAAPAGADGTAANMSGSPATAAARTAPTVRRVRTDVASCISTTPSPDLWCEIPCAQQRKRGLLIPENRVFRILVRIGYCNEVETPVEVGVGSSASPR